MTHSPSTPIFRSSNLIDRFNTLQPLVEAAASYELQEKLQELRQTYASMLHYLVRGIEDTNALRLYDDLVQQCYAMADRAERLIRLQKQKGERYAITQKQTRPDATIENFGLQLEAQSKELQNAGTGENREAEDAALRHEATLQNMFETVWTSDAWSKADYEHANELLESDSIGENDKALLVSSVTLALTEMFDFRKMMFLLDACLAPRPQVSQRAMVGIILTVRQHDSRIPHFKEIESRLSIYADDPNFTRDFFRILMQLQYSKMTDSVSARMRNDIIPNLLRSGHFKQTQYGIQEIDDYMTRNGENPEWHHNKAADEKAQAKMREMAEMQMEGADVYMASFSQMKGFDFFRTIGHWFMPFDSNQPDFQAAARHIAATGEPQLLSTMMLIAPFCSSDKYSFAFMMNNIGKAGQDMLAKNLLGSLSDDEISDMAGEARKHQPSPSEVSRLYIFDLYRFFQLYPFHHQFANPFDPKADTFSPLHTKSFAPMLRHQAETLALGEFFMRKGIYQEAIDLFLVLHPEQKEADSDIWQKIGFCEQKLGRTEEAYNHFSIAYNLNPNSAWTLKHLAQTAFARKKYKEAEVLYDTLLDDAPDQPKYLTRKAECLMGLNRFAEALPLLYKVTYLEESSTQHQNQLALCLLMTGETEKAINIYRSILDAHPADIDALFSLGNAHFAAGRIGDAYNAYHQALEQLGSHDDGPKQFKRKFVEASRLLQTLGINIRQVEMLYDAVCLNAMNND